MNMKARPKANKEVISAELAHYRKMVKTKKVNFDYEIPYVAGYSNDGKTIYIDKHLPKSFRTTGGKTFNILPYLILHETSEKDYLDKYKIKYQAAHHMASAFEQAALREDGWSSHERKEYDEFFKKWIKTIQDVDESDGVEKIPKDLDLEPYEDEKDKKNLKEMMKT